MKKNDLKIAASGILIAILCIFLFGIFKSYGDKVVVTVNGKIYTEKPINNDCEIDINGTNILVIENGEVYMKSATCRDHICIEQGKIHDSSKKIICLPNKIVVSVEKSSEIDAVVR